MALVKINLMRQDLTAGYNRYGKTKNHLTYTKRPNLFQKEFKIFIYKLLTIVFVMWTAFIHLSQANRYYQVVILGIALLLYLTFEDELHRKK